MLNDAQKLDPSFKFQETRSVKGDFLFIGSGHQTGLKNVLIIRKDGSVLRMEADKRFLKSIEGGGHSIFDVDVSTAEVLISPGR